MPRRWSLALPLAVAALAACSDPLTPSASDGGGAEAGDGGDDTGDSGEAMPDVGEPDGLGPMPPPPLDPDREELEEAFAHVFPTDRAVEIRLDASMQDWVAILNAWKADNRKYYIPAGFRFDDESLDLVGIRLKGFSSLGVIWETPGVQVKAPLKIEFDEYDGPRFHGIDKIGLSTAWRDPSQMRAHLAQKMYAAMGVKTPHLGYADVYVGSMHLGLYTTTQVIDKRYLKERWGTLGHRDDGNLYKCTMGAGEKVCGLVYMGETRDDYVDEGCMQGAFDECGLVLKTNEDDASLNNYDDLVHFLDRLNHSEDDQFVAALENVFDVDSYLRYLAVSVAIGNWDSHIGRRNNYYLYRPLGEEQFTMIAWDFDLAYGIDECVDWALTPDAPPADKTPVNYPWCDELQHPLVRRVLAVPEYRDRYLAYLDQVVDKYLTVERHEAWIEELDAVIGPVIESDPTFGWDVEEYELSLTDEDSETEVMNLLEFVEKRRAFIFEARQSLDG